MSERAIIKERSFFTGRKSNILSSAGKVVGLEAFMWIAAIIFLAFIQPAESTHFTICPLSAVGFDFCPGCGLGRSVSYLLHGDIINSFSVHPLGIFAFIVLTIRIISLLKINWSNYGKRFSVNARA